MWLWSHYLKSDGLAAARKCLSAYLEDLGNFSKDFKLSSLKGNHQLAI